MAYPPTGYHVPLAIAEDYVRRTGNPALQVKFYPDRHGQYASTADHGVWHSLSNHWVFVDAPPATADIDFLTCTMDDVIARSILLHPTMLQDALTKAYRAHLDAATTMVDGPACRMAHEMSRDRVRGSSSHCQWPTGQRWRIAIASHSTNACWHIGAAYKLQCLPYATAMDIATRGVSAERDNG